MRLKFLTDGGTDTTPKERDRKGRRIRGGSVCGTGDYVLKQPMFQK